MQEYIENFQEEKQNHDNDSIKMAKDDISLGVEMGRLEIQPVKMNKNVKEENPFTNISELQQKRSVFSKTSLKNSKCFCSVQKKIKDVTICKKKHHKILREPVLKLLQNHSHHCNVRNDFQESISKKCSSSLDISPDNLNLCALVDNCNQLRISSGCNEQNLSNLELKDESQWWKTCVSNSRHSKDKAAGKSQVGSCSQQALNPPCDVTIDELASYFETLVHIPKKMSSMAEMMYI